MSKRVLNISQLKQILTVILVWSSFFVYSQTASTTSSETEQEEVIYKPSFGVGLGMFTYYGDISKSKKDNGATLSRVALDLHITQPLNSFLNGSFYFLKGKVAANERSLTRNLNFESTISVWGVNVSYNFDHFLPKERYIEPFVSLGIESVEFLSKTDLYDAHNNPYYYWSDGSIRSDDELHPEGNPANIRRLERDFTYESDVRESNLDGFGKYRERTYAVPVGIGFNMLLNEQFSFRLSTTYHFTFTDYIDGVTVNSVGNRKGNKANDGLLYTSFSLNYNINQVLGSSMLRPELLPDDLMAQDEDGDGVIDFDDRCPNTPDLVQVDERGCPLDGDHDGVADYLDEEPNTPDSTLVDSLGKTLTDEMIEQVFAVRNDSTGKYGKSGTGGEVNIVKKMHFSEGADKFDAESEKYMVRIGEFTGGLPVDVAEELLSMKDVNTWEENGTTYITVGNFDNIPDAMKRKLQLAQEGFDVAEVVKADNKGKLNSVKGIENMEIPATTDLGDPKDKMVFRIQIGAYRKKIAKKVFKDVPGVVMVPFEDGINRYFSGSYNSFEDAAKSKIDMIAKGYTGAFIVAFQNGKRISLKDAGVVFVPEALKKNATTATTAPTSNIDKSMISFGIQIGVYKTLPTVEEKAVLSTLKDVKMERTEDNLLRYFIEGFKSYEEANAFKQDLINKGLSNCSTIGRFKNSTITAQEAIELLK